MFMLPKTPRALWLTGLPAAGKTTLAEALVTWLHDSGRAAVLLDGDVLRKGSRGNLGFSRVDRATQAYRTSMLAAKALNLGQWPVVSLVSPYRSDRAEALSRLAGGIEIHVCTPLSVCMQRDPKGLYAAARRGMLTGLTGIDDVYEVPLAPDVRVDAGSSGVAEGVLAVLKYLDGRYQSEC